MGIILEVASNSSCNPGEIAVTRERIRFVASHQEQHFGTPLDVVAAMLAHCAGYITDSGIAVLEIGETLPHTNDCRSPVVNDHWLGCVQAAIRKLAKKAPLPQFDMALVGFCITMPRGVNNARIWDASNRAINLVLNNLKGAFFPDDNIEHMAFAVRGCWADEPKTTVCIGDYYTQREEIMRLLDTGYTPS
jgi:hypothetical protein